LTLVPFLVKSHMLKVHECEYLEEISYQHVTDSLRFNLMNQSYRGACNGGKDFLTHSNYSEK